MNKKITQTIAVVTGLGAGFAAALMLEGSSAARQTAPAVGAAAPLQAAPAAQPAAPATTEAQNDAYPYKSPAFTDFVDTSYKQAPTPPKTAFYLYMQEIYDNSHVRFKGLEKIANLDAVTAAIRKKYEAAKDPEEKALIEKQTSAFYHRMIKKSIRHFSLDRGFEFYNVVDRSERQCLLQSTLFSALMQRAGMNSGVVMVARSDKGEESNNGHAVALVKLSNGRDVLVDISHKQPFIRQQGLMAADTAANGDYRYVAPQYAEEGDQIVGYAPLEGVGTNLTIADVRALSVGFLQSQFDYYRGERTPGGFFAKQKTPEGLADSERFFTRSLQEDARNPLPAYALGRVEFREGKTEDARRQFIAAYQMYSRYGYVPQGEQEGLALVHAEPQSVSMR